MTNRERIEQRRAERRLRIQEDYYSGKLDDIAFRNRIATAPAAIGVSMLAGLVVSIFCFAAGLSVLWGIAPVATAFLIFSDVFSHFYTADYSSAEFAAAMDFVKEHGNQEYQTTDKEWWSSLSRTDIQEICERWREIGRNDLSKEYRTRWQHYWGIVQTDNPDDAKEHGADLSVDLEHNKSWEQKKQEKEREKKIAKARTDIEIQY